MDYQSSNSWTSTNDTHTLISRRLAYWVLWPPFLFFPSTSRSRSPPLVHHHLPWSPGSHPRDPTSPASCFPSFYPNRRSAAVAGVGSVAFFSLPLFPRGGGATTEQAAVRRGAHGSCCTPLSGESPLPRASVPGPPAKNLVGRRRRRSCSCWTRDPKSIPP